MSGMRRGAVHGFVIVGACGGGGGSSTPVDAAIDAVVVPDAVPDAPFDAPAPPQGTHRYVASAQTLPATNQQARDLGLDLDGDLVVDNQLGQVFAVLAAHGLSGQADTDAAVARGEILMLGELVGPLAGGPATFTLFSGANPIPAPCASPNDTTCRLHLQGTATFDLDPLSAKDTPLAGAIAANVFDGGPGELQVQFTMALGDKVTVDLVGARVKLSMLADGTIGESIIAGAITQAQINTVLIPSIATNANAVAAADCTQLTQPPLCGCAPGSTGKTMLDLFDTNPKDCAVSVDEIAQNTLIQSLLTTDVVVGGQAAMSVGFGVSFVRAGFTP
jgi:hypothetical protein